MKSIGFCVIFFMLSFHLMAQTPPKQPTHGPAGTDYIHGGIRVTKYGSSINDCFWIIEPTSPKPDSIPYIIHWHGTTSQSDIDKVLTDESPTIQHHVKKGYGIIYPLYQYENPVHTLPSEEQLSNAMQVLHMAFDSLNTKNHTPIKLDGHNKPMIAATGGSRGGGMALKTAARMQLELLPTIQAIASYVPGKSNGASEIDPSTNILIVNSDSNETNYEASFEVWEAIDHVPCRNKRFIEIQSDYYGDPPLIADHSFGSTSPSNPKTKLDALDYFGTWKYSISLFNCTFYNKECSYCLTDEDSMLFMGFWSDGSPVMRAVLKDSCFRETVGVNTLSLKPELTYDAIGKCYTFSKKTNWKVIGGNGVEVLNGSGNRIPVQGLSSGVYAVLVEMPSQKQWVKKITIY